jgi:hypothetical protein
MIFKLIVTCLKDVDVEWKIHCVFELFISLMSGLEIFHYRFIRVEVNLNIHVKFCYSPIPFSF